METKIGQYKGIEVEVEQIRVNDEDVQGQITSLLQSNPNKISQDRPLQEGDTALFDFTGLKEGVAFDGGTATNYELVIGSNQFIPGFESQMVGMVKGEEKDLEVTFPENYGEPTLAGQPVVFKVKLHDIFEMQDAELTDEFVKGLNMPDVETVEALNNTIVNYLEADAKNRTTAEIQNAIFEKVIAEVEAEIEEKALNDIIDMELQRIEMQMQQQGMSLEQYLQMTGSTKEDLMAQITPNAEKQAKLDLAFNKIIELENITVSDDEINERLEAIAQSYQMPLETIKQVIKTEDVAKDCRFMKVSQLLLDNAKITYKN